MSDTREATEQDKGKELLKTFKVVIIAPNEHSARDIAEQIAELYGSLVKIEEETMIEEDGEVSIRTKTINRIDPSSFLQHP